MIFGEKIIDFFWPKKTATNGDEASPKKIFFMKTRVFEIGWSICAESSGESFGIMFRSIGAITSVENSIFLTSIFFSDFSCFFEIFKIFYVFRWITHTPTHSLMLVHKKKKSAGEKKKSFFVFLQNMFKVVGIVLGVARSDSERIWALWWHIQRNPTKSDEI